jgi:hypothetical protein
MSDENLGACTRRNEAFGIGIDEDKGKEVAHGGAGVIWPGACGGSN